MIVTRIQEGTQGDYAIRVYDFTEGLETIAVISVKVKPEFLEKINEKVIKEIFKGK